LLQCISAADDYASWRNRCIRFAVLVVSFAMLVWNFLCGFLATAVVNASANAFANIGRRPGFSPDAVLLFEVPETTLRGAVGAHVFR
jgi:hypothetical protein